MRPGQPPGGSAPGLPAGLIRAADLLAKTYSHGAKANRAKKIKARSSGLQEMTYILKA
jgi:hypothetical protein